MNDLILETTGLYKAYTNGAASVEVLKGVNLKIKKNEFVAIQGPSGAGKSTLLHIAGGLDAPNVGEVYFEGKDIYQLSESERATFRNRKIGFVFQFYHLLPEFTALENVLMPCILKSWWERKKSMHYAKSILKDLGLSNRLQHKPSQLSGGEQQRVAIARALANKPQVLLCDEPTGNLDSDNGQNILKILRQLNSQEKLSVVLVTHDNDIAKSADRVIHLKDGVILN